MSRGTALEGGIGDRDCNRSPTHHDLGPEGRDWDRELDSGASARLLYVYIHYWAFASGLRQEGPIARDR